MGRPRKQAREPFWRSDRSCYYVQHGSRQLRLAPDRDEAWRLWHELMARPPEERRSAPAPTGLLIPILDSFLEWSRVNRAAKTYTWYRDHVQVFCKAIPRLLTVAELRPHHLTAVMDAHESWSASTKHGFARAIQRACNWAERQGLIDRSPIPRVEKPTPEAREVAITPADYADLLARFPDAEFRDLLAVAWETGARPNELFRVEARHVDLENKRWTFQVKESKGKRKARHVYLSSGALEITARLMARHPTGPLLRNAAGEPWTKDTVNRRFLRKKKALGRKLCLYDLRHAFCQRMLLAGKDLLTVSTLMGHASPAMVMKHYSNLQRNPEFLAASLG